MAAAEELQASNSITPRDTAHIIGAPGVAGDSTERSASQLQESGKISKDKTQQAVNRENETIAQHARTHSIASTTDPTSPTATTSPSTPATATGTGTKRKRTTGATSRGVANLTPDQLARKRANDREAQRAIRERTKNHIDRLNQEISELKAAQPYIELQKARSEKAVVESELRELKRRIEGFFGNVKGFLDDGERKGDAGMVGSANGGGQSLNDLAAAAASSMAPSTPSVTQTTRVNQHPQQSYYVSGGVEAGSSGDSGHVGSPGSHSSSSRQHHYQNPAAAWNPNNQYEGHSSDIHPNLARGDERLGLNYLLDNSQNGQRITSNANEPGQPTPSPRPSQAQPQQSPPIWTILPRFLEQTCPLDGILLNFLEERQRMAREGCSQYALSGDPHPNFNALMNMNTKHVQHPLSKLMTDILRTFPDLSKLPEQVAVLHVMFLVMRWMVDPTRETYEQVPEWIRPTESQVYRAHPHWLDYLPWPLLRDAMVNMNPCIPFSDFFIPFTTTLSLNWPYDPRDVLLPRPVALPPTHPNHPSYNHEHRSSSASGASSAGNSPGPNQTPMLPSDVPHYVLNPVFESHLRDLSNWSLGDAFADEFPMWEKFVRIKRGPRDEAKPGVAAAGVVSSRATASERGRE